jgi:hypothetical protein
MNGQDSGGNSVNMPYDPISSATVGYHRTRWYVAHIEADGQIIAGYMVWGCTSCIRLTHNSLSCISAWFQALSVLSEKRLQSSAFKCNLYRYNTGKEVYTNTNFGMTQPRLVDELPMVGLYKLNPVDPVVVSTLGTTT